MTRRLGAAERLGVGGLAALLIHAALLAFLELAVRVSWPVPRTYLGSVIVDLGPPPTQTVPPEAPTSVTRSQPTPAQPQVLAPPQTRVPPTQPATTPAQPARPTAPAQAGPASAPSAPSVPPPSARATSEPAEPVPGQAAGVLSAPAPGEAAPASSPVATPETASGVRSESSAAAPTPAGEVTQTPEELLADLLGSRATTTAPAQPAGEGAAVAGQTSRGATGRETTQSGEGVSLLEQLGSLPAPTGQPAQPTGPGGQPSGLAAGGAADDRVQWDRGAQPRALIQGADPDLTGLAVSSRVSVEVRISVMPSGVVASPQIIRGATPEIERAVLAAVSHWLFQASPGAAMAQGIVTFTFVPRR